MNDEVVVDEVVDDLVDEVEDDSLSYDDEFNAIWGTGSAKEVEAEEGPEEVEDVEDEVPEPSEDPAPSPAPAAPTDPYAWISALPEEVRKQAESLRHSAESHQGRAVAFQRRLQDAQEQLDKYSRQVPPAEEKGGKPDEPAAPEPPEWAKLKEDFPEFAEAVDAIRAQDRQRHEALIKEALSPIEQERHQRALREFQDNVTRGARNLFAADDAEFTWSDVKDVVDSDDFRAWLDMQPPPIQAAASTPNADSALYVLKQYHRDYHDAVALMQDQEATPSNPPTSKADKVRQSRQKRLNKSNVPPPKAADHNPDEVAGDYEAMFNARWG